MVMSTLHTNDAPQTLTRMADMGIPPFAIATTVNVIIAQRLARRLCSHCKRPVQLPKDGSRYTRPRAAISAPTGTKAGSAYTKSCPSPMPCGV
jgi:type II secretory ATPase GspE/PulE/Tfp pilus assembly ATPase PilB-like protein